MGSPARMMLMRAHRADGSPAAALAARRAPLDAVLYDARSRAAAPRRDLAEREDILSMLVTSTDMDDRTLRDELLTLLVAGHETTATALAWALERLAHHPEAWERLRSDDEDYLGRGVKETLRLRPVVPAVLRMLKAPVSIAGYDLPAGVAVLPNILLMHTREDIYPDPFAFRPERFLEQPAGTYTWIPFGGGVRRCLGASFAIFEMKAVLRAVAGAVERLEPGRARDERPRAPRRDARAARREGRGHRGATSSACAPRATGPVRSLSTELASPAPPSAICVSRVEQHPLAHRLAQEVHGELGVDEQVAAPVEHVGGAVAGVGDDHHALARRRLLALDDRDPHARPDRRGPAVLPAAARPAPLDRVRVAERLAERRRRRLAPPRACRRAARTACRRASRARARRGRAARPAVGADLAGEQLDRAARPLDARLDLQLGDRHRAEDLDRDPREHHVLARRRCCSSAPVSSADGGPACWWRGSHGPLVRSVAR